MIGLIHDFGGGWTQNYSATEKGKRIYECLKGFDPKSSGAHYEGEFQESIRLEVVEVRDWLHVQTLCMGLRGELVVAKISRMRLTSQIFHSQDTQPQPSTSLLSPLTSPSTFISFYYDSWIDTKHLGHPRHDWIQVHLTTITTCGVASYLPFST